jgi:hypothetical protein
MQINIARTTLIVITTCGKQDDIVEFHCQVEALEKKLVGGN